MPERARGSSGSDGPASWRRGCCTASSASSRRRSRWAAARSPPTVRARCARSRSSRSARACSCCSQSGSPPMQGGDSPRRSSTATTRERARRVSRSAPARSAAPSGTGRSAPSPWRRSPAPARSRREREEDHRRRARDAARPLHRARRRPGVRRRGAVQRLPRGHLQVREEAEEGRDERGRGGGRDGVRHPRATSRAGVVFGLVGWFLVKAAWEFDPKEARGLDGALLELSQQPYGGVLLGSVAVGPDRVRALVPRAGAVPQDLGRLDSAYGDCDRRANAAVRLVLGSRRAAARARADLPALLAVRGPRRPGGRAGSFFTCDAGDVPIVVVRDRDERAAGVRERLPPPRLARLRGRGPARDAAVPLPRLDVRPRRLAARGAALGARAGLRQGPSSDSSR